MPAYSAAYPESNCIWSRCNATEVKFDAKYHAAYLAAYHAAYLPAFLGVVEWCGVYLVKGWVQIIHGFHDMGRVQISWCTSSLCATKK